jgi:cyanate lyase
MSASIILDYDCERIQAAMAVALLQHKNALGLTYRDIGKAIEREPQSVQQYICDTTEMPASCWLKAVAKWPELNDRLEHNLNEAERAFRARQRAFNLEPPAKRDIAA